MTVVCLSTVLFLSFLSYFRFFLRGLNYILIYFRLCLIYQNLQYKLQYIQPKNVPLALSMIALSNNNNTKMRIVWKANFHNEIGLDDSYYLSYQGEGGSQLAQKDGACIDEEDSRDKGEGPARKHVHHKTPQNAAEEIGGSHGAE